MADPNLPLQKALFIALTAPAITYNGSVVPVYAYAPSNATAPYILLDQIVTVPTSGAVACNYWECVFQLTVLTSFPIDGQASDEPSFTISDQISEALAGKVLPLQDDFQMNPILISRIRKSSKFNSSSLDVLRYIEVKIKVFKNKQ